MKRFCQPRGRTAAVLALVGLVFLTPATAQAQQAAAPAAITIEGITAYKLPNGLQVLLYPDLSSSRVTVNMTVLVGSRHEGYGETGMAHLLEHMLFKGTTQHPDVPKALRDHGANFNGTTWVDRTNYFETMPSSDANLKFAIALEADRLVNSLVRREDLASEMTVVRSEFESGENNPVGILRQRMLSVAFEWHNYGKSTIGNRTDIERVPIDRLQAFYRKYYRPDNAVLVVAGRFDMDKAKEYIARDCGRLKKPRVPLDKTYTEEPAQDGERQVELRRVGKVGAVGAVYHIPAAAHPDFAACEVLANVLDYEPGGRLYKELVLSKKATDVSSIAFAWHDPGVIEIIVKTEKGDEKDIRGLRNEVVEAVEKLAGEKFTKEEVERVKGKLLKQRVLLMTNPNRVGTTLSEWVSKGDWRLFFLHRDRLEKVTPEDVARVAGRYLLRSNRTSGLFVPTQHPDRAKVPGTPDLAELVKDYKGGKAIAAGEVFDPTPENIEKRVKRVKLPSGIKAAFLSKKTRDEAVVLNLTLRYGNEESLKGFTTAADFLGELMRRGTKDMTRQQLDDALDKLQARLSVSGSTGAISVSIQARRKSLPEVLTLLGKVLRQPSFPAEELDVLKRQQLEHLQQSLTEPGGLARRAFLRKLFPYPREDVRYTPTIEEEIDLVKGLKVDRLRQLYAEQVGGQHGELSVVGDFDPDAVTKQVGDLLKGWTNKIDYRHIARKAFPGIKGERSVIDTPDKANAVYISAETFVLKDSDPDYPALVLGNYLLGEAPLASRLSNRVRGKEGLSYGVGSQLNAGSLDPVGMFLIFAIYNPTNAAKVDKAINEVLDKFFKEGVTAKELEEGIKAYLKARKNSRSSDSGLASQLATMLRVGRTFAYEAAFEKKLEAVTPPQVQAAFRKHVELKRLVLIQAGDFKKKPANPQK